MFKLTWKNRWGKRIVSGISHYSTIQHAEYQVSLFRILFPDNIYTIEEA